MGVFVEVDAHGHSSYPRSAKLAPAPKTEPEPISKYLYHSQIVVFIVVRHVVVGGVIVSTTVMGGVVIVPGVVAVTRVDMLPADQAPAQEAEARADEQAGDEVTQLEVDLGGSSGQRRGQVQRDRRSPSRGGNKFGLQLIDVTHGVLQVPPFVRRSTCA